MNSQNYSIPVQDSMADSELTENFMPDLLNSSYYSKENKQGYEDQHWSENNQKWIMEVYSEDKIDGTPQK
jgi:hypothetical protein